MENASKAIIMAGAVLIATFLISLTLYSVEIIRNYTKDSEVQSYSNQTDAFNRFFIYSSNDIDNNRANGIQIRGSDAYNIIAKVNDINNDEWSMDEIEIIYDGASIDTVPNESVFLTVDASGKRTDNKKFTYTYTINSVTGLVNQVRLTSF